jgi:hypothetical protein
MKLQGRNLSLSLQGADVALLHTELTQLGFSVLAAEIVAEHFGASTQKAVASFQQQHGLPSTGVVDASTAAQINAVVDKLPARRVPAPIFAPEPTPTRPTNPAPPPASTTPLIITPPIVVPPPVVSPPPVVMPPAPVFVVRGQVRFADGKPLPAAAVQAVDRDLRGEEMLGQSQTDPNGRYEIRYTANQFSRLEKSSADLVVRAINSAGVVAANSSILFNAPPEATIDLVVGGEEFRGPSEYEQLLAELSPLLPTGVSFADLTEDATHQDISFLAGETGQESPRIAFLAAAYRLAAKTSLSPEAFYALFRENLPTDLANLQAAGSQPLSAALVKALEENIVPASLRDHADAIVGRLVALDAEQPHFVVTPAVLYASLAEIAHLPADQLGYITAKLNLQLGREILKALGTMSPALGRIVHGALAQLDYRPVQEQTLSALITSRILVEARRDASLADELTALQTRLAKGNTATVAQILHLDLPVQDHPAFLADVRRMLTLQYAQMSQVDVGSAKTLAAKLGSIWEVREPDLAELVVQGLITDAQKSDLLLTFDLGRLTGDNIPFVSTLKGKAITSMADVIGWEKADWQQLITSQQLQLPPGETVDSYADTIAFNIERTYPAQSFIKRILNPKQTNQFQLLDSLNELLLHNDQLLDGANPAVADWGSLVGADQVKAKNDLQSLADFSNTYRSLGVAELINDKTLAIADKKAAIAARVQLIGTFDQSNPNLDLRLVDFFDQQTNGLDWSRIPTADQPGLRKQVMAYQRVISLADGTSDRHMLMSKGHDSAFAITAKTENDFVKTSGLEPRIAHRVYASASDKALAASHGAIGIRDAALGIFGHIAVGNQPPELVNDLKRIDGFSDLFIPQNYCQCDECRSILGPAAYFADLMKFIELNISKPTFIDPKKADHPLYLKNRRPDLWTLQLTCENTSTLIPYLTIVDEVLERYLGTVLGVAGPEQLYATLSLPAADPQAKKISFGLPFCLPLEELRLYLSHFGIGLYDIYALLKQPEDKIWRTRLNLSQDELGIITSPDPSQVALRFGASQVPNPFPVQDFIRFAGLTREQLDDLLTQTFNPDVNAPNVKIDKQAIPDDQQDFAEVLVGLTDSRLDFIHRFVRLWKKTPWTIAELDLVLTAMKESGVIGADLDPIVVVNLAQLAYFQEKLKLTVEELCALLGQLPVSRSFPLPPAKQTDLRLYERLFDLRALFGEDVHAPHALHTTVPFHSYWFDKQDKKERKQDLNTPRLLAGLGISETELLVLFRLLEKEIPFDASGNCQLDRQKLSLLYRHVRLARSLKLSVDDFVESLQLLFASGPPVVTTIAQSHVLVDFADWLKTTPFTVSELRFVIRGEESDSVKYANDLIGVATIVQDIQKTQGFETQTVEQLTALLKDRLAKLFNLSATELDNVSLWVNPDLQDASIQSALKAALPKDLAQETLPGDLNPLLDLVHRVERVVVVAGKLKLSPDTIAYLTQKAGGPGGTLGIPDLKQLQLDDLEAFTIYKRLITRRDGVEPTVQTILASSFSAPATVQLLANLWQQDVSLIKSLTTSLTLPAVPIHALDYFGQCLGLCQTLGVNGYSLQKLTADDSSFVELEVARDAALGAFSSKYPDDKQRQDKLEPYQDRVNVKKRDALCDYIIARHQDLKFQDLRDIYAFFLLDVEMSGCFRTSRIVCANSSLQLYVQRCLTNLEQSEPTLKNIAPAQVDVSLIPADQWEWRKNYRVWQANRKVFLYAHRYLDPDVRDDKTPIFKELEEELLQEKITKDSAEAAYRKYVSQLAELARLRIAGSYVESGTYYFFGRTDQDPPQCYYRTFNSLTSAWTSWIKIALAINAKRLSGLLHLGKLYIFWIDLRSSEKSEIQNGGQGPTTHTYTYTLSYSCLNENEKWLPIQKLRLKERLFSSTNPLISIDSYVWGPAQQMASISDNCFAVSRSGDIYIVYHDWRDLFTYGTKTETVEQSFSLLLSDPDSEQKKTLALVSQTMQDHKNQDVELETRGPDSNGVVTYDVTWKVVTQAPKSYEHQESFAARFDPFKNKLISLTSLPAALLRPAGTAVIGVPPNQIGASEVSERFTLQGLSEAQIDYGIQTEVDRDRGPTLNEVTSPFATLISDLQYRGESSVVGNSDGEFVLYVGEQPYLVRRGMEGPNIFQAARSIKYIGTSLADNLGQTLFTAGLSAFLSLQNQTANLTEKPLGGSFMRPSELFPAFDDTKHLPFKGAYGVYYRELFLHIPLLMFKQLNADGQFEPARWWLSRIFDPTASEPDITLKKDRNWQYLEFRELSAESMRAILTDEAALEAYRSDPFNPHAIARLRLSEYQKYAVTMYVRNELDWGDALFAEDSIESLNEATMHYVLAYEILGKRPVRLGPCDKPAADALTYNQIGPAIDNGSEFLISLENWGLIEQAAGVAISKAMSKAAMAGDATAAVAASLNQAAASVNNAKDGAKAFPSYRLNQYSQAFKDRVAVADAFAGVVASGRRHSNFGSDVAKHGLLAFCVPADEEFLQYWGRVDDRLFKIRNCMNISGVRRQLALFQPPIDPMALIRAKAAGLSLDDILSVGKLNGRSPPYRFTYLIERAKQFTQTVQSFGSALLSALEKKDAEELTLLRSLHERAILRMTKEIKSRQVQEAQYQLQALIENKANIENRINYYQDLLDHGLTLWEHIQQTSQHVSAGIHVAASAYLHASAIDYLVPQVGSPFSLKYGGKEAGDSFHAFGDASSSLAVINEVIASAAGLEATFQRREQDWSHQLDLARQELIQVEQQRLAADIRERISERDLEIHESNIDQADELYDFYKSRFSGLGLYTYLATTLNRIYREAYLLAYDMGKLAQQAYQFERDDESALFVAEDNWQSDRAGLLAGERLLLQLQRMEQAYILQNVRDSELTQSFSLALVDANELLALRETGSCRFAITEPLLQLFNPGLYKCIIKAVRVTIPCVAGPHASVSATLSLEKGTHQIRMTSNVDLPDSDLWAVKPDPSCTAITVNAQSEGGVFDLSFRDERYLPFEGAGLISTWRLDLPSTIRMFDYATISDVILNVSFRASFDGKLKNAVEGRMADALTAVASSPGLFRLFSLRREFPTAYHRLLNPVAVGQSTDLEVTPQHFPYFLAAQKTFAPKAVKTTVYLRARGAESVDMQTQLSLNGVDCGPWTFVDPNDPKTTSTIQAVLDTGSPVVGTWTITAGGAGGKGLDKEVLDDVLILLQYKISQ